MSYYKYNLFGINSYLTDGVKDLAENKECFWLINAILSHQIYSHVKGEGFQVWTLKKQKGDSFMLTCDDGNGNVVQEQEIEFSDFPDKKCVLWFIDGVLLLPSEY